MRVVAIIQARMGSTRLPGKVMEDLAGESMLTRCVQRAGRTASLGELVVATSTLPTDEPIVELCERRGWPCSRGSEADVLDRYYQAARAHHADAVVRITSDCPLIDPGLSDRVIREFLRLQPQVDYLCNTLPRRTFPRGLDTEVVRFDALERAWHLDADPATREHVTLFIRRSSNLFRLQGLTNPVDLSHMRWTVDTPEDLAFVRRIYGHYGHDRFSWEEVLALLHEHPEWLDLNRHVQQKEV